MPDAAAVPAGNSIGAALHVASQLGGQTGATLIDQAQHAFRDRMAVSVLAAGAASIVAMVAVIIFLQARAAETEPLEPTGEAEVPVEALGLEVQ